MKHPWVLILACGWVLLQPPPKLPIRDRIKVSLGFAERDSYAFKYAPNLNAPLSEWLFISSHDTAKECGSAASERMANISKPTKDKATPEETIAVAQYYPYVIASRCVPATLQLR